MRKNHARWLVAVLILGVVACALLLSGCTSLFGPEGLPLTEQPELNAMAKKTGWTIQDEVITYSAGHYLADQPLMVGYDPYGYNYQAHMFNGYYANVYLGKDGFPPYEGDDEAYLSENPGVGEQDEKGNYKYWYWPYRHTELLMKWNDAWLSNKDCDGDGKLDRHYGHDSYIGSGAWETNHQSGTYDQDEKTCKWNYFVKIVAVPEDAYKDGGTWCTADGTEIGPVIWGAFAIIQQVYNDPCEGAHGVEYLSPAGPGFGKWK